MEVQAEIPQKEKPKRRTVAEFLKQYRSLGRPNAKRFRRRSRLEQAAHEKRVAQLAIKSLIHQAVTYRAALDAIKKEENWATFGDENEAPRIEWVGESDPLEIIRKAEEEAAR